MARTFETRMQGLHMALQARPMLALARFWINRLGNRLPGHCALCGATGTHVLCDGCRSDFFGRCLPRCGCCALPLASADTEAQTCGQCSWQPPAFDATVAAADYAAPLDQLVLGLKFGGRLALAPLFAEQLRAALSDRQHQHHRHNLPDLLTPVPLGPARLRERGFNQSLEIARPLSLALGVPLLPRLLVRVRDTPAQSRLAPAGRHLNLLEAFTLTPKALEKVRGRHVGVVDDVMTTGATLNEVAATLKRLGAARVTNLVFARTPLT